MVFMPLLLMVQVMTRWVTLYANQKNCVAYFPFTDVLFYRQGAVRLVWKR